MLEYIWLIVACGYKYIVYFKGFSYKDTLEPIIWPILWVFDVMIATGKPCGSSNLHQEAFSKIQDFLGIQDIVCIFPKM